MVGRFVKAAWFDAVALWRNRAGKIVAVLITNAMPELFGAGIVSVAKMTRYRNGLLFLHRLHSVANTHDG